MRMMVACWVTTRGRPAHGAKSLTSRTAQKWKLEHQLTLVSLFLPSSSTYLLHLASSFLGVSLGGASVVIYLRWYCCLSQPRGPLARGLASNHAPCWVTTWGRPAHGAKSLTSRTAQKWKLEHQLTLVSLFSLLFYLLHLASSFLGVSLGGASVVICLRWHYCPSQPRVPLARGLASQHALPRLHHLQRLLAQHPPVPMPERCRQAGNDNRRTAPEELCFVQC